MNLNPARASVAIGPSAVDRIGGEGRSGEEYAVVTADGFLPLLGQVRDQLPPGTLVRIHQVDDHFELRAQDAEEEDPA